MKKNLYIFNDTLIKRKDNTILCQKIISEDEDRSFNEEYFLSEEALVPTGARIFIPVESLESVMAFGNIRFNSRFLYFLSQNSIPLHIFNQKGFYRGSYFPPKGNVIGKILLAEAVHYQDKAKKLTLARQFVIGGAKNMLIILKYYNNRQVDLSLQINEINNLLKGINNVKNVDELRGIEGNIRRLYYSAWEKIFIPPVSFKKRIKNPPADMINSLISYGNMVVYAYCLNEIYFTGLYPEVGYLHEPGFGKMSLCYDLAEIFKPILTDRIIFKVINKYMITENDFKVSNGFCFIKEKAKKLFVNEFNTKLYAITRNKTRMKRNSYKMLINDECVKLKKHFLDELSYKPYLHL